MTVELVPRSVDRRSHIRLDGEHTICLFLFDFHDLGGRAGANERGRGEGAEGREGVCVQQVVVALDL